MNQNLGPGSTAAVHAARELAHLQKQAEAARAVLAALQQDVAQAQGSLGSSQAAQLLEANERLVVAALHARTDAETSAQALSEVSHSAGHDALTELPNRALMLDRFALAIANANRHGASLALLFLDLDNFKQINDTFGHALGDQVLKVVAQRLTASVRATDTVSRHGGDEFLILLGEVAQAGDAGLLADKLGAALGEPCHAGAHIFELSASIGISVFPQDGADAGTLIERADAAMYRAKRQGLGSYFFHGQAPAVQRQADALKPASTQAPAPAPAGYEQLHAQQQEANEQLVLAALKAREGQSAAEQVQRRQTEFLAVLAHELRNPLAPIRTAAALLGRVRSDEPLVRKVQAIIERQAEHMSRLVGDLLDISRVSTGKLRLELRPVEIAQIIEETRNGCWPAMDQRRQHFEVDLPVGSLAVNVDAVRMSQIVCNLLDNASKYTPEGGRIGLSVVVNSGAIVLTVSDNGIGIAAESLPNVFEPFVQDPHAVGFNGAGLGLGLTVVRELVLAHGGEVVAHSAGIGMGSEFVVTLPRAGPAPGTAG